MGHSALSPAKGVKLEAVLLCCRHELKRQMTKAHLKKQNVGYRIVVPTAQKQKEAGFRKGCGGVCSFLLLTARQLNIPFHSQ